MSVVPKPSALPRTSGSTDSGTSKSASSSGLQAHVWISKRLVRAALVASVAWSLPPVRRQTRKLSTVPKARSLRSRAPGTASSSQASLVAEK